MSFSQLARYLWASPASALGLVAALLLWPFGARARCVDGIVEIAPRRAPRFVARRFGAITLGHVVIGVDFGTLDRLRAHEQVHVRQYERFGPLFIALYLGDSAWQWLRGRDAYRDNRFEREARARARRPMLLRSRSRRRTPTRANQHTPTRKRTASRAERP